MNTKHLSLFLQVIKTGNITQVADALHISQPAISMQLKRLEKEVGVPLFTIVGRNIAVTDAGHTFAEYAESILSLEGQIYRAMDEYRQGHRGKIVVGTSPVVGTYILPQVIQSFTQSYADITVEFETYTDDEIERLVRIGSIDAGLTLKMPEEHFSMRVTRYANDRLIGIQPAMSFNSRRVLIPRDINIPNHDELNLEMMRLDSTEAVKRFVMEGIGYGITLESAAKVEIANGNLHIWNAYQPYPVTVNVITRPAERLSKSLWLFLDHLRK